MWFQCPSLEDVTVPLHLQRQDATLCQPMTSTEREHSLSNDIENISIMRWLLPWPLMPSPVLSSHVLHLMHMYRICWPSRLKGPNRRTPHKNTPVMRIRASDLLPSRECVDQVVATNERMKSTMSIGAQINTKLTVCCGMVTFTRFLLLWRIDWTTYLVAKVPSFRISKKSAQEILSIQFNHSVRLAMLPRSSRRTLHRCWVSGIASSGQPTF